MRDSSREGGGRAFGPSKDECPTSVGEVHSCPCAKSSAKKLQLRQVCRAFGEMEWHAYEIVDKGIDDEAIEVQRHHVVV